MMPKYKLDRFIWSGFNNVCNAAGNAITIAYCSYPSNIQPRKLPQRTRTCLTCSEPYQVRAGLDASVDLSDVKSPVTCVHRTALRLCLQLKSLGMAGWELAPSAASYSNQGVRTTRPKTFPCRSDRSIWFTLSRGIGTIGIGGTLFLRTRSRSSASSFRFPT